MSDDPTLIDPFDNDPVPTIDDDPAAPAAEEGDQDDQEPEFDASAVLNAMRAHSTDFAKVAVLKDLTPEQLEEVQSLAPELTIVSVPDDLPPRLSGYPAESIARSGRTAIDRGDVLLDEAARDKFDAAWDVIEFGHGTDRDQALETAAALYEAAQRAQDEAKPFGPIRRTRSWVGSDGRPRLAETDNTGRQRVTVYDDGDALPPQVARPPAATPTAWPGFEEVLAMPTPQRLEIRRLFPAKWQEALRRQSDEMDAKRR